MIFSDFGVEYLSDNVANILFETGGFSKNLDKIVP